MATPSVIVRGRDAGPAAWEQRITSSEPIVQAAPLDGAVAPVLAGAGVVLIDAASTDAIAVARGAHRIDAEVQVVIVAEHDQHGALRRTLLFTPGLGETWIKTPEEVGPELVERAAEVSRQRRSFRATHARLEHDLAAIEPLAERRAFVSDAFLAALLKALPDPVLAIDGEGTVLSWNAGAENVLGISRGDAVGRSVYELLNAEDPHRLAALLNGDAGDGAREIHLRRSNAPPIIAAALSVPIQTMGRSVMAVILRDVTEERRAQQEREERALEVEMQAEELRTQAVQLEEAQVELEGSLENLQEANRALAEAKARLESILRRMPSGVVVVQVPGGRIEVVNAQVRRLLGSSEELRPGEYLNLTEFDTRDEQGRPLPPEAWPLTRSMLGEVVTNEVVELRLSDGGVVILQVSSAPIQDENGAVIAAIAVLEDITAQKHRQQELAFLADVGRTLASSLEYQETLLSVARAAVPRIADWCAVDVIDIEDGRPISLAIVHSDATDRRLGRELARRWQHGTNAAAGVAWVLRSGEPRLYSEIPPGLLLRAAEDEEHHRLLRAAGLRSLMILPMIARGRTLGTITFVSAESGRRYDTADLLLAEQLASRAAIAVDNARLYQSAKFARQEAERAQARAHEARIEAETANRAKSDFLATMSHEIRTPINAIIGYTELLRMQIAGPLTEAQEEQLQRVHTSSRHLLSLIEDVLDLAKVEAGRLEIAREEAAIGLAVAESLALIRPQAMEKDIRLVEKRSEEELTFVGDENRVRQVLLNILSNAVKFTDAGGEISVECALTHESPEGAGAFGDGPWTIVRITDSGIGLAPEEIERVFQPFVQAEAGLTRTRGGTGLGLAISRQLARLMGGDLTATSVPGVGSTFTLWLPTKHTPLPFDSGIATTLAARAPKGLGEAAEALRVGLDRILDRYLRRMVEDRGLPMAASLSPTELADHTETLLSDVATSAAALAAADTNGKDLFRDGSEIQRLIADLHGAQRARHEWTEPALRVEFELLQEIVQDELRTRLGEREDAQDAMQLILRFLAQAEQVSRRAFRRVRSERGQAAGEGAGGGESSG